MSHGIVIEEFLGGRAMLMPLLRLADDADAAIERYRDAGSVLVARAEQTIVGQVLVVHDAARQTSEIKSIAVEITLQRQGIGQRLVDAAIDHARRAGSTRIEVATATADIGNLRFYQRLGFRMSRIVRDVFDPLSGYPAGIMIDGIPLRDQIVFDRPIQRAIIATQSADR